MESKIEATSIYGGWARYVGCTHTDLYVFILSLGVVMLEICLCLFGYSPIYTSCC